MPVNLRGHHFLCMLTYKGMGYSAEFTANMSMKIADIKNGAPVRLIHGPDDICAGLSKASMQACSHDCSARDILDMDVIAENAVETVLARDLSQPAPVTFDELEKLRTAYRNGSIRQACDGCSWLEICNQIVAENFSGTFLLESAP
ncbi:MAG: DUF1284 domain-containing protein [Notoacmeibacter sp.]